MTGPCRVIGGASVEQVELHRLSLNRRQFRQALRYRVQRPSLQVLAFRTFTGSSYISPARCSVRPMASATSDCKLSLIT